jgi:uncharacterized protein YaaR (DUF327 family)
MSSINYNKMTEINFYKHLFETFITCEELRNKKKENMTKNEWRIMISGLVESHTQKIMELFSYKEMIQEYLKQLKDLSNTAEDDEERKLLCDVILRMPDWWTEK